ncbi:hypothetical protein HUG15_22590 [Salicibibacter cibarius]|uniref:Uncharacterized protein n=1 Tax=Salicibibacter cibarius TaxID=2743000 RepID=A0A7T6Z767_9BACI|nr:hypothetical protein [Salicibibacter cibarius]QQK78098.1 hypothetical protein HUG15_22590 [Salicibibacter cibarius]
MAKKRVTYTWKLSTERDPDAINEWLDAQSNIRDSLSFLVQVMQERFGNVDIRDIETSKELLQFMHEQETKPESKKRKQEHQASFDDAPQKETEKEEAPEAEEDEADDIFSGIDGNAIFTRR